MSQADFTSVMTAQQSSASTLAPPVTWQPKREPSTAPQGSASEFENEVDAPCQGLLEAIQGVSDAIAPVWPLRDYVAVNPYLGFADRPFLSARRLLRAVSDGEMLMPLDYYRSQYQSGRFAQEDVEAAVAEIVAEDSHVRVSAADVMRLLNSQPDASAGRDARNVERRIRSIAEIADQYGTSDWSTAIREEIGKHCGAHYDEGQATWGSPWKGLSLFQAWRLAAQHDRRFGLLGATGFRRFVATLPHTPVATIAQLLRQLNVPQELSGSFLLCQAHTVPGWSAWTKYKSNQSELCGAANDDFIGLLAIRMAYDVAVAKATGFRVDWGSVAKVWKASARATSSSSDAEASQRLVLLRATEIAYQRTLIESLTAGNNCYHADTATIQSSLAQMVFCIDVRSERFRRQLESVSSGVETFGFAGFFGMPIAFQGLGETCAVPQVPALLSPEFVVEEGLRDADLQEHSEVAERRGFRRLLRKHWKQFQASLVSCFGFVETAGLAYGWKLAARTLGLQSVANSRFDGVHPENQDRLGPDLSKLEQNGVSFERQLDLAESALRGIGLTKDFAPLVVFCGHASETTNNPLQAGLDCGACCGHSGEFNARFAAALLNLPEIRSGLSERGIHLPEETRFVAALHNTTSDEVKFFEEDLLTESQHQALRQLKEHTSSATAQCQLERMPQLAADNVQDLLKRTLDWSEVRPEWGLAGNAAFIVAPREMTGRVNLDGRSFLHSYDFRTDDGFRVLEQIMTAPLVVGHWINMQYYASTVDNRHYGSGSKTIHNVVGQFGVFSGNGGDLQTGLPLQSVHNGKDAQHEPLRLLAVVAAPREAVADIIRKHKVLEDLLVNGWLNLVVVEDGIYHRYTTKQTWQCLSSSADRTDVPVGV